VTFLELVDAERALRTAEQAELEARAHLAVRTAELARALGETPANPEERQ
jgi:outer membrane protein TolC